MNYTIRKMRTAEYALLPDFLYGAIYLPPGVDPPPKSVVNSPELQVYTANFGRQQHDMALVAEICATGEVVGAIWARIMDDYGHIDNTTPSIAMSVCPAYRGQGIGTALLQSFLSAERAAGCKRLSLSVQKDNYAAKMYQKQGFVIVGQTDQEYIMAIDLLP